VAKGPKKPRLNISLALAQAMAAAGEERQKRMAAAIEAYGIDAATGWSVNLEAGEFRFTLEDHELVGVPQLLGVFSKIGKTWTWGWAVDSIPDDAKQTSNLAREFARQHGHSTMPCHPKPRRTASPLSRSCRTTASSSTGRSVPQPTPT
jgi:hypothetical protein